MSQHTLPPVHPLSTQPAHSYTRHSAPPSSHIHVGQQPMAMPSSHMHPDPPATQVRPALNTIASQMQQMNIQSHPGQQLPGQSSHQRFPPPPISGQSYGPPSGPLLPTKPPLGQGLRQVSRQVAAGRGSVLPPPPINQSSSTVERVPPPTSLGQISHPHTSGQLSAGQLSHQLPGQFSRQSSGQADVVQRQALLPTPPGSGQGLLPPPTSGVGLLPPPPTLGHGILPTPHVRGGILPPPTGQAMPHVAMGDGSGQGILPPPSGQQPPRMLSNYPPLPPSSGQPYYSGQGILPHPPTPGQGSASLPSPPMSGQSYQPPRQPHNQQQMQGPPPPPPSSGAMTGQGSASLPPPPMSGQPYQPPGQPHNQQQMQGPPPPPPSSGAMTGQAHPPPPHTSLGAPPTQFHMSHSPHPNPQPPQPPQPPQANTDPELKPVNLMDCRNIVPPVPLVPPKIVLPGGLGVFNPKPEVMCCTMNAVPTTSSLLNKMKLPLAIHIHPYKDLSTQECPVIHPSCIVRCRVCRAYINPFVVFVDSRHWRCNLCFRPNSLPEEFDYNSVTDKHGDRSQRMEIRRSSVEYIAPSEYMLRPPQPCVYFFVIDVSYYSVQSGVLAVTCRCLLDCLGRIPGDARTLVGFLTVDSSLHFYNLSVGNSQPQMMIVSDIDDAFLPSPDSLLVNLKESKDMVRTLLEDLPGMFSETSNAKSALGAALQVAEKLLHSIGGRVTVIQASLPTVGPGALKNRDVTPSSTKKDTLNMAPGSDFYKKLALELSSQQIAVDLFCFSSQFIDLTTLTCVSKFSSGQVFYYPDFHHSQHTSRERFEKDFIRYLTRKIGFEAVMRIRCTEGLSLHTFHGNFFVRSTDLLSLPNTNPDHGYTINLAIDENLKDMSAVCCQAALLYTSSRGERRIRVHTICLPVSSQPSVLYSKLNVTGIAGVLANMAVDRATSSSIGDARDALLNTVVDCTKMYRSQVASANCPPFTLPSSLAQLPLFILSLLKYPSFTLNSRITYDVRAQAMNMIKSHPLYYLMPTIYPSLYALHTLTAQNIVDTDSGQQVVEAPVLQLSAENLSRYGIFLMDCGLSMYVWVSSDAPSQLISKIFGVDNFEAIPEDMTSLPVQDNESSKVVNMLIKQIRLSRQHYVTLLVIRERGPKRLLFVDHLLDGKTEDGTSYYEFLAHINRQLGK